MSRGESLLAAVTGVLIGICLALAAIGLIGSLGGGAVFDWSVISLIATSAGFAAIVVAFLWHRARTGRTD